MTRREPDRLLSIEQVADLLAVSTQSVYRLIRCGDLSSVRLRPIGAPRIATYVTTSSYHAFIESRTRYARTEASNGEPT